MIFTSHLIQNITNYLFIDHFTTTVSDFRKIRKLIRYLHPALEIQVLSTYFAQTENNLKFGPLCVHYELERKLNIQKRNMYFCKIYKHFSNQSSKTLFLHICSSYNTTPIS